MVFPRASTREGTKKPPREEKTLFRLGSIRLGPRVRARAGQKEGGYE